MSIYSTGTVQVKAGSAQVKGETGNENFLTYVATGYVFKVASEDTWYQVAAITNATNLTLSSRYDHTSYRTSRSSENSATMTPVTKIYSGTVNVNPVIQNNFKLNASIEWFTDNGAGVLTGDGTPAGSGTIDYDTGAWAITLGTDVTATALCVASYLSGDTRVGIAYQIVTDYTSNYDFPEMSINDTNFQNIYTRAVRSIDSNLYNASSNTVKVSSYFQIGSKKYIFAGTSTISADIIAEATALVATPILGSLYMGVGDVWKYNSDTTATKI